MYRRGAALPHRPSHSIAASSIVLSRRLLTTRGGSALLCPTATLTRCAVNPASRRGTAAAAAIVSVSQSRTFFFSRTMHAEEQPPSVTTPVGPKPVATVKPSEPVSTSTAARDAAKGVEAPPESDISSVTAAAAATPPPPSPVSASHAAARAKIEQSLTELRERYLEPYDKVYHFLAPCQSTMPMVMLLGNHSSGKSTLINFLTGRELQETGVAPTDDGFTVIKRDTFDMDSDGPSVVSNPKYQYRSLQQFGLPFVTHFKMKTRTMPAESLIPMDMVLVDTPGMIDTPVHASRHSIQSMRNRDDMEMDSNDRTRGYDFLGVTRWFAQQSDVILLMFDPANPGTTGETLDVLTKSLAGYEHKFLLVMNKTDVFEKVTDFARAYGTLCWNLSKVIRMKDIPRVYTTYTPLEKPGKAAIAGKPGMPVTGTVPAAELSRQRDEVVREILSAPMRRMDNMITELEESARNIHLAMRVARVLRSDYRQREIALYAGLGVCCLALPATAIAVWSPSILGTVLISLLSVGGGCGGLLVVRAYLQKFERDLLESSDDVFYRLFTTKTRSADVELRWRRTVRPEVMRVASTFDGTGPAGITMLPSCSARALRAMEKVVTDDVPALRREVSEYKESFFRSSSTRRGE